MDQDHTPPQAISPTERTRFFILTASVDAPARTRLRLLVQSLRAFGGQLRHCPVWVFVPDAGAAGM